jgi:iron(III) transport system permease protein
LTVAVYDTWLDRNSLAGAAQIACVMLLFVFALLLIERALRAKRRYHHTTGKYLPEEVLEGWRGVSRDGGLRHSRAARLRSAGLRACA